MSPPPPFFFFAETGGVFVRHGGEPRWGRFMLTRGWVWLNCRLRAGGTQMSQSVDLNVNMTSAAPLAVWSRLTYMTQCCWVLLECYSSNVLKYYLKFCCKVHWSTVIVAYTSVNLHLEHYTLYHSATQRTDISLIVCEKNWWQASWILKWSPKHPVCPLVVGCCKIFLAITSFLLNIKLLFS